MEQILNGRPTARGAARLLIKRALFPGPDLNIRQRGHVLARHMTRGVGVRTLDAGCGNGYFSLLACRLGNEVVGISADQAAIERCIAYRDFQGIPASRLRYDVHNLYDLRRLAGLFDQIVCLETLEHVWDDGRVIQLFYEKLTPGGRLLLGVPNALARSFYGEKVSTVEDGGHVRAGYTYDTLESMLMEAGFTINARDTYGGGMSRRALVCQRRLHDTIAALGVGGAILLAIDVATFFTLYPLTYLDPLVKEDAMSIFVVAIKPPRQAH